MGNTSLNNSTILFCFSYRHTAIYFLGNDMNKFKNVYIRHFYTICLWFRIDGKLSSQSVTLWPSQLRIFPSSSSGGITYFLVSVVHLHTFDEIQNFVSFFLRILYPGNFNPSVLSLQYVESAFCMQIYGSALSITLCPFVLPSKQNLLWEMSGSLDVHIILRFGRYKGPSGCGWLERFCFFTDHTAGDVKANWSCKLLIVYKKFGPMRIDRVWNETSVSLNWGVAWVD